MLCSAHVVKGFAIQALNGQMGKINEFYFDDGSWQIRYLVVDVGNWLKRQQVLLSPEAVTAVDPEEGIIDVNLSKEEVEASPDALEQPTVSRQMEIALYRHYDWTPYWATDPVSTAGFGHGPAAVVRPGAGVKSSVDIISDAHGLPVPDEQAAERTMDGLSEEDLRPSGRLRGTTEVKGYHVHALDGDIGHVSDFFLKGPFDRISYLIVDTGTWLAGKKVIIPPMLVQAIHWDGSKVDIALTKEEIQNAPEYTENSATFISPSFETELKEYYARKTYG